MHPPGGENKSNSSTSYDIIAEDSVSYSSKMSGADADVKTNEKSECACSRVNAVSLIKPKLGHGGGFFKRGVACLDAHT